MITAIILVIIITLVFSALNKRLPFKICPICAGVSGSWLLLTAGIVLWRWSGDYKLPIAMLMGATVAGIAFQGEAKLDWAKKGIYMWKAPVIIFGMPVAYWLFKNMSPWTLAVEVVFLAFLVYYLFVRSHQHSDSHVDDRHVGELEEKMKSCC